MQSQSSRPIRVLLVEDDVMSARFYEKMLASKGYKVFGPATTGTEALEQAREEEPDVILMDINIQGEWDGVEAANRIIEELSVPIIYASGASDDETILRAKRTGPFAYLLKPFTRKELFIAIEMALSKAELEKQTLESEHKLSSILGNISGGVIATDANGKIEYLNPAASHLMGTTLEDCQGSPLHEFLDLRDKEDRAPVEDLASRLLACDSRSMSDRQYLLYHRSRDERLVQLNVSPIANTEGSITGYVTVLNDETEEWHTQNLLRTLAQALESLDEAVIITRKADSADTKDEDNSPSILFANSAFKSIFGWDPDEIINQPISVLEGERTEEKFCGEIRQSIEGNQPFRGESFHYDRNGRELITEWHLSPVVNPEGKITQCVAVIRDLTQLRRLEENIRQAQKIEAVGRLSSGIAHDFNNLLSVINSYADLLMLRVENKDPIFEYVDHIRNAGQKGADLVSKLMTFSRRNEYQPERLELAMVVREVEGILGRLIREDIELKLDVAPECRPIFGDRGQIEQTLVNMVVNARDALPRGGTIEVSLDKRDLSREELGQREGVEPGEYTILTVSDDGIGMDADTREHVFEPFFTTKDIGKGTGLGLSAVYGMVRRARGFIELDSAPGEGTTLRLFFPVAVEETPSQEEEAPVEPDVEESPATYAEAEYGSEKILIVEDDETFADCMSGLLSLHGYYVETATSGVEALEKYRERTQEFRLLITDVIMPGMSGLELSENLQIQNPALKTIFMTGYDEEIDQHYDFPKDATILQKPVPLKMILSKVRELLDVVSA